MFDMSKETFVVVNAPDKKSAAKKPKAPAPEPGPDVSALSFIKELTDSAKFSILRETGGDVPNIRNAYDMAKDQGGVDNLAGWIIFMTGKFQRGEIDPPVKITAPVKKNRFNNFEGHGADYYARLEQLEEEQFMASIRDRADGGDTD